MGESETLVARAMRKLLQLRLPSGKRSPETNSVKAQMIVQDVKGACVKFEQVLGPAIELAPEISSDLMQSDRETMVLLRGSRRYCEDVIEQDFSPEVELVVEELCPKRKLGSLGCCLGLICGLEI